MDHFKTGGSLTPLDALHGLGIYNFSARMSELKHEHGEDCFMKEMIKVKNRFGEVGHVMKYMFSPVRDGELF